MLFKEFSQEASAVGVQILGKSRQQLCFEQPVALAGRRAEDCAPTCSRAGSQRAVGCPPREFHLQIPAVLPRLHTHICTYRHVLIYMHTYVHTYPHAYTCNTTYIYLSEVGEPRDEGESVHLVLCHDYRGKANKHQMKQSTRQVPLQLHVLLYGDRQA